MRSTRCYFATPDDVMRLVGPAPMAEGQFIEIVLDEAPLRKAMLTFSVNILLLSLVISGITAMLVFFALHYLLVRPMGRITANMITFRADPENPARIIAESGRSDEIGTAEEELAAMQRELASMLHQKNRLAALGLAVSKINHDLRNLLASAQLFSDQLSTLPDPKVQRFAPKLMRALERAIAFCQSTLSYGAAQEPPPERKTIEVEPLIEEVHEALGLGLDVPIRWIVVGGARAHRGGRPRSVVPRAGQCGAQRACRRWRRAARAIRPATRSASPAGAKAAWWCIEVSDTGPGVSEKARDPYVPGLSGLHAGRRRRTGPRHCRRTGARPWRRNPPGAGNHRRDLQHHDSRPRGRSQFPARRAGERVAYCTQARVSPGNPCQ